MNIKEIGAILLRLNPMFRVLKTLKKPQKKSNYPKIDINENKITPFCQFNVSCFYIPIVIKIKI